MLRTRVGYAGGTKDEPSYHDLGDHSEAIQVEFDPERITFDDLLAIFLKEHDPFARSASAQYKAVLWTHGEAQAKRARKALAALARKHGREPKTEVRPAPRFWIAEDYHQKYYLRGKKGLLAALLGPGADGARVRESTLAARANGWVAGYGTAEQIAAEIDALELGEKAREALRRALGERAPVTCR